MDKTVPKYVQEARRCLLNQNYGKAYAFYLLVLKLCPHLQYAVQEGFSAAWREWSTQLRELGRVQELLSLYEQGCEVFFECDMLHFHMGNALYHMNMKLEAINVFRKALIANESCFEASVSLENACRGVVDSWHFIMLNDKLRNEAFERAIKNSFKSNDVILDIGAGSGILSMVAAKLDPKIVNACEMSKAMNSIANECLVFNKLKDKINLLGCHSSEISVGNVNALFSISEKCTLAISETVDAGLLGEGIIDTLHHAWKHLLISPGDGGRVIPYSAVLHFCIIESEEIYKKHVLTQKLQFPGIIITSGVGFREIDYATTNGFDHSNGSGSKVNECDRASTCNMEPYTSESVKTIEFKSLSKPKPLLQIDFNDPDMISSIYNEKMDELILDCDIIDDGFADALVIWFDLKLEPGYSNVIHTGIDSSYCWDQAVYPIRVLDSFNDKKRFHRLKVSNADSLKTMFQIKSDCLLLESIVYQERNYPQIHFDFDCTLHITVSEEQLQRMNDSTFLNSCFRMLLNVFSQSSSLSLLDISNGFDLIAVKIAQCTKYSVHKYCQTPLIYKALNKFCTNSNTKISLYKELPVSIDHKFDVILLHVIEPSGLISPNAISNLCKVKHLLEPGGCVVPNHITLIIQCVESVDLLSKCMVVSDENTLDLGIAKTMNDFRVSIHSDLNFDNLTLKFLSEPIDVLCLDLNVAAEDTFLACHKSVVVKASNSGSLDAILFWFRINVSGIDIVNTKDPSNHWKQAAYIFPFSKQLDILQGKEIVVKAICRDDSILFRVSEYGA